MGLHVLGCRVERNSVLGFYTAIVSFLVGSLCASLNAMCILEGDGRRIGACVVP